MEIRLLGSLEVLDDAGVPVEIRAPKLRLLTMALALRPGRTVTTAQITEALWEDEPPSSAPNLVQGYVAELRKRLGADRIRTMADGYVLAIAPDQVDVEAFDGLCRQAARATAVEPEVAARLLGEALSLWRGPALGGDQLTGTLTPIATRLDEQRLAATEDRVDAEMACGRQAEVIGALEELAATNPYRERIWGQLVIALYRTGRQADALQRLTTVRKRLLEDLGVVPGDDLRRLEGAILRQDPALRAGGAGRRNDTVPRLGPLRRAARGEGAFVGRAVELAALMRHWRNATAGSWQTVLVGGEPGIGKTRLLLEAAARLDAQGANVLYGRCDEDVFAPYQPFAEALTSYFASHDLRDPAVAQGSDAADFAPADLDVLSDLVPGLPSPGERQPSNSEPRTMLWIFDAFIATIATIATRSPVVLVIDDLHWADSSTLGLLRHVSRRDLDVPVLLLVAYRDTDIEAAHPLRDLLADLRGESGCEQMTLTGFTVGEIEQYLAGVDDTDTFDSADSLRRHTGGNPLFLGEMLRHRAEAGDLGTPIGVTEVIVRRIRRLSAEAQRVLRLASVLGEEFEAETLRELAPADNSWLSDGLEEAIDAGLLVVLQTSAPPRCAFTHSVVRSVVYNSLSPLRRQDMHALAAATMERILGHSIDHHRAAIASHYRASGRAAEQERALAAFMSAAEQADRTWAKDEAVRWYDAALELLPADDSRRTKLRLTRYVAAQTAWHWHYDQRSIRTSRETG